MAARPCILHVRSAAPAADGAVEGIAAGAVAWERWTPLWEAGEGGVYLDLTGTGRLLGRGADGPARVCRELAGAWRRVAGGSAPTRLAAGLASALAASWLRGDDGGGALLDVTPQRVVAFLAPYSVGVLAERHPQAVRMLQRRGVRTLGDLQAIPQALLASLLGAEGARIAGEAAGRESSPLRPSSPQQRTVVGLRLARPLTGAEPRAALLRAVALRAMLACPSGPGACAAWTLRVRRGRVDDLATAPPAVGAQAGVDEWLCLLETLWRQLPQRRPGVTALGLLAGARQPQARQQELFTATGAARRLAGAWRRLEGEGPRALHLAAEELLARWGIVWDPADPPAARALPPPSPRRAS